MNFKAFEENRMLLIIASVEKTSPDRKSSNRTNLQTTKLTFASISEQNISIPETKKKMIQNKDKVLKVKLTQRQKKEINNL